MPGINQLETLSAAETRALIARLQAQLSGSAEPRPRRRKKDTILYLTEEELAALFRAIDAEGKANGRADPVRDRAMFEVALGRGLRASEVGLLQMKHLRIKDSRLYVTRLKGGRTGEYLLTDRETRALKPWIRERGWLDGPLFMSRNRRPISRRRLDELMKVYGRRAGLPREKQHFHCMRHTCATRLLEQGLDIAEVQDILGHEDIRNTAIYAKITNQRRLAIGAKLKASW